MAHTWFVNHYDSRYRYTCETDDPPKALTWAVWSWADTPPGNYRVEVYIPPQEATAIVTYRVGSGSTGLIVDPVRLNQSEHRGSWATVVEGYYAGGRLWVELGDNLSDPSGPNDWCAWGGHHSIGAADARLVRLSGPGDGTSPRSCSVVSLGLSGGSASQTGEWSAGCESARRSSYARLYEFSLSGTRDVQVDLESDDADTYLYLLDGSGGLVGEDDDSGSSRNSRIVTRLDAGTYRIEATTFSSGETGSFRLQIRATSQPRVDLSEPRNVRIVAGDGELTVSWDPPARTAGLIDYDLAYRCPSSSSWIEWRPEHVSSTQRSVIITGLANGVACDVRVWAHSEGLNAQSGGYTYATATPQASQDSEPDQPRNLVVTPHSDRITVSWSRPTNGGSPITGYTVTYSRPELRASGERVSAWRRSYGVDSSTRSHTLRTRRESVIYTVAVTAHNANGSSRRATAQVLTVGDFLHDGLIDIPDLQHTGKVGVPGLRSPDGRSWSKAHGGGSGGPCGFFGGCGPADGFYYINIPDRSKYDLRRYALWDDFGNSLRGRYSVEVFIPGSDASVIPSATVRYTIQERRPGRSDWRNVGYFVLDQSVLARNRQGNYDTKNLDRNYSAGNGLIAIKTYDTMLLKYVDGNGSWNLDGQARVRAEGKNGILAADSIRLIQQDLLDIDKDVAILRCQNDVLNQLKVRANWRAAFQTIGNIYVSALIGVATAGVGTALAGISTTASVTTAAATTLRVYASVQAIILTLRGLLKLGDIYSNAKTFYDSVRVGMELGEVLNSKIREELDDAQQEAFDLYHGACSKPNGIDWHTDRGSWFPPEALLQALNRNGYMEYRHSASIGD